MSTVVLLEGVGGLGHLVVVGLGTLAEQVPAGAGAGGLIDGQVLTTRTSTVPPQLDTVTVSNGGQVLGQGLNERMNVHFLLCNRIS